MPAELVAERVRCGLRRRQPSAHRLVGYDLRALSCRTQASGLQDSTFPPAFWISRMAFRDAMWSMPGSRPT